VTVFIEDSARNVVPSWGTAAVEAGVARGVVMSPFTSPRLKTNYLQSGRATADRLREGGGEVWFDPMTHAHQMPNVGDFRYYDGWDLWSGGRGTLDTSSDRLDHVNRVFAAQDALAVPHLAPTIMLHSPQSATSQRAVDVAEAAISLDPNCHVAVAGTPAFWGGGGALDAHVGALAQLQPAGWFVVVVRNLAILPVTVEAEEVHGLCRTVRSLSEDGPVHVSHGDLAGLPAVVAGATSVGTGWDSRQRVCAYPSYEERTDGGGGGQWSRQTTFGGLLSLLSGADAALLNGQEPTLCAQLLPGTVPPDPREIFLHHTRVLTDTISQIQPAGQASYEALRDLYVESQTNWESTSAAIGGANRAYDWTGELLAGLTRFAATEGW
jgi:hypothetical protein